jgi:WD40 repeat protein
VSFSPDGKALLTGSEDNTARLWRADTGAPLTAPLQHQGSVLAVDFSPDGEAVLTGSSDKTARLWRADTGAPITPALQPKHIVRAVAFSPDGQVVLTGSADNTAQLWRAGTGTPLTAPLQHGNWVEAVAFNPDGKAALTGSGDGAARFWRTDTGAPLTPPLQHQGEVINVAFSPDGRTALVATARWLNFRSWDGQTSRLVAAKLLPGRATQAIHFDDPQGRRVRIVLTDTGNTAFIHTVSRDLPDSPPLSGDPKALLADWQRRLALTFDPQGRLVLPSLPTLPHRTHARRTPRRAPAPRDQLVSMPQQPLPQPEQWRALPDPSRIAVI